MLSSTIIPRATRLSSVARISRATLSGNSALFMPARVGVIRAKSPGAAFASAATPPPEYYALIYDYVPDILDKRGPYREGHLAAAAQKSDEGKMVIAGALADPVDGAMFIWKGVEKAEIEAYVASDPYVKAGLVPSYKIRPYMVVAGYANK